MSGEAITGSALLVPHFTGDQMLGTTVSKRLTLKSKPQKTYKIGDFIYIKFFEDHLRDTGIKLQCLSLRKKHQDKTTGAKFSNHNIIDLQMQQNISSQV